MRRSPFVLTLSLLLSAAAIAHTQADDLPAAAQPAYKQGLDFEQRQQLASALDSLRAAQKQAGSSLTCLQAIERVQMEMEKYKDAAATAAKMASLAPTPQGKAAAEMLEGQALYRQSFAYTAGEGDYDKNPKKASDSLKQAEASLHQGAADDPSNEPLLMLHGRVLAALHEDEQASADFKACAAVPGTSAEECARALRLSGNVVSARDEPAPSFELKTLDGQTVSRDSLAGKVVLVDFWATWCPACRRDSDYIQSMIDTFPDPKRFVLLEVSVDENQDTWKNYVDENRLHGTQTRDTSKQLQSAFHVYAFPTYVVLDGNGSMRFRATGTEGDIRGTIRSLLAEQSPDHPSTPLPKSQAN
jgi:thiol-disulfide isomerase/thioredoxin